MPMMREIARMSCTAFRMRRFPAGFDDAHVEREVGGEKLAKHVVRQLRHLGRAKRVTHPPHRRAMLAETVYRGGPDSLGGLGDGVALHRLAHLVLLGHVLRPARERSSRTAELAGRDHRWRAVESLRRMGFG